MSAQSNEVLSMSEESFLIDLKETEDNLLQFSLTPSQDINKKRKEEITVTVPLMTRIYENIIGDALATTKSIPESSAIAADEPEISLLEVSHHDSFKDCWIVIYDRVYDVTKFLQSVSKHRHLAHRDLPCSPYLNVVPLLIFSILGVTM